MTAHRRRDPVERLLSSVAPPSSNSRKHESKNPLLRLALGHFTRTVCRAVTELRPRTVLDVGCGEGYMLDALRRSGLGARLAGVDLSTDAIIAARARLGDAVRLEAGDAREIADLGAFDVVLMLEVLEHLVDPEQVLDALAHHVRGHVVLSVPHEPLFRGLNMLRGHHLARLGNHPEHLQQFTRAGFIDAVRRRFDIVAAPIVPPWTMVVARPLGYRCPRDDGAA